jgi:hypothetical protein
LRLRGAVRYLSSMKILREPHIDIGDVATVAFLADAGCRESWMRNLPPLLEQVWERHRPELFCVAGDLSVNGLPEEYEAMIRVLEPCPAMLAAVPGDHDRPLRIFTRYFGATRKIIDAGPRRFIGLNTAGRRFSAREAGYLEASLGKKNIIFSHLPPAREGWTFHSLSKISSDRFLDLLSAHAGAIEACFFGHIHGFSIRLFGGIPLIATGGVAESWTVHGNGYRCGGFHEMMILDTASGRISLCRME